MKILIASTPATGHLNPLLAIGRILMAEGHEVAGLSANAMRPRIEEIGAEFHAFPAGADFDLSDINGVVPALKPSRRGRNGCGRRSSGLFVETIPAQHKGLRQALRNFPADVVIGDDMFFGVLPMLLGPTAKRPPVVLCGTSILHWRRPDRAPQFAGLPPAATAAQLREYAAIADEHDRVVNAPLARRLNRILRGSGPRALADAAVRSRHRARRCLYAADGAELRVSARHPVHGEFRRHASDRPEPGAAPRLGP